jgi:hypothetical protein
MSTTPVQGDAAPASTPPRRPASPPGQKRARHKRWTRIASVVTVAGLVAFLAFLATVVFRGEEEDEDVVGCRQYLADLAAEVSKYAERRGRLPANLGDLRDPEGTSPFDAEPWDCWHQPFEYLVVDEGAREFRIRSIGRDGRGDTEDDILWPQGASWR